MKIAAMIKEALEKRGLRNLKESSQFLGISTELLRMIINKGHVPKDKTLIHIAKKLDLNAPVVVLAAHQATVPEEVKGFFLSPSPSKLRHGRAVRKHPLSQEQCEYLEKIMKPEEIQLVRKLRQVTDDGKKQVFGYVDYMFATQRVPPPEEQPERGARGERRDQERVTVGGVRRGVLSDQPRETE